MQPSAPESARSRRAGGFTLLEIVIVFVIIGIAAALVVPALLPARDADTSEFERVIDAARRNAIDWAEPLTLALAADGAWVLERRGAAPRTGTVRWSHASALRLHISPLGACTVDTAPAGVTIDPIHCTLLE